MQSFQYGATGSFTFGCTQFWSRAGLPQLAHQGVEMLEMPQDPSRHFRRLLAGFVKLAPHMSQASRQDDLIATPPRKAVVGFVAVALEGAAKVHRVIFSRQVAARLVSQWKITSPRGSLHVQR